MHGMRAFAYGAATSGRGTPLVQRDATKDQRKMGKSYVWHSHSGLRNAPYSRMQKWLQRHAAVAKWSMAGRKQTLSASRRATDAGRRRVGALHGPLGPERVEDVEHVVNP